MANSTYSPLPPKSQNIRLIRLLPASWSNKNLKCLLQEKPIHEARNCHITISYTWGNINATKQVLITSHGVRIPISENIYTILRRLRRPTHDVFVWADALCINQFDNLERTHQVGLMGQIYKNSAETIIWLGEQSTEDGVGERFIPHVMSGRDADIWVNGGSAHIRWTNGHQDQRKIETYNFDYSQYTGRWGHRMSSQEQQLPHNDFFGAFCLIYQLAHGRSSSEIEFLEIGKMAGFQVPPSRYDQSSGDSMDREEQECGEQWKGL